MVNDHENATEALFRHVCQYMVVCNDYEVLTKYASLGLFAQDAHADKQYMDRYAADIQQLLVDGADLSATEIRFFPSAPACFTNDLNHSYSMGYAVTPLQLAANIGNWQAVMAIASNTTLPKNDVYFSVLAEAKKQNQEEVMMILEQTPHSVMFHHLPAQKKL